VVNGNGSAAEPTTGQILLTDSNRNRVVANDVSASSTIGVVLVRSDRNRVQGNQVGLVGSDGNGDLGIEAVAGVGDGGRNRAAGNGNRPSASGCAAARSPVWYARRACAGPANAPAQANATSIPDRRSREQRPCRRPPRGRGRRSR
jgi:parallel beta-helix repeat protein